MDEIPSQSKKWNLFVQNIKFRHNGCFENKISNGIQYKLKSNKKKNNKRESPDNCEVEKLSDAQTKNCLQTVKYKQLSLV